MKKQPTNVQSVLLPVEVFTEKKAVKWVADHGFKTDKLDKTDRFFRFRQADPKTFKAADFRTKTIDKKRGIKIVIGHEKKKAVKNPAINVLVDLGRCDGFEVAKKKEIVFSAKQNYRLLSTADGRILYALKGKMRTVHDPDKSPVEKQAEKLYSRWSDFEPDKEYMLQVGKLIWKKAGEATKIFYTSDKWSPRKKLTAYVHDFEHKTTLHEASSTAGKQYKLTGAFAVRKEGITG